MRRVSHPLIFVKEDVGSFCGIQIPVRETTETSTCCEIPLLPLPLTPQTNPAHILRTAGLYTVCVYLNVHESGCNFTSICTFAFLCATLRASWVVPGAWGTWPIAFPAEVGAAAAVWKHTDEQPDLLSVEDQP